MTQKQLRLHNHNVSYQNNQNCEQDLFFMFNRHTMSTVLPVHTGTEDRDNTERRHQLGGATGVTCISYDWDRNAPCAKQH